MNNIEREQPTIVSQDEWLVARKAHLEREKALTRLRDQVSAERRELPWVKIEKNYVFDTPNGKETLTDLFDGRSQLIVYHFMFGPSVRDGKEGCKSCSFLVDHVDGANVHLAHHDVTFVAISRTPLSQIEPLRIAWAGVSSGCRRMGATSITTFTCPQPRMNWQRVECITTTRW